MLRWTLNKLRQITAGLPTTVVAYVRRYDQWIESRYAQYIKESRGQIRPLRKFYLGQLEASFFLSRLQAYREKLPNCRFVVCSFDDARANGLVEHFLLQTGIQQDSTLQTLIREKGLSNRGRLPILNFVKAYATAGPNGAELAGYIEDALKSLGDEVADVPFANRQFGFLSYKLKRQARQLYQADVSLIREQFDAQILRTGSVIADDELRYAVRLKKREYLQTLEFLRPHLDAHAAERLRDAFSGGARAIEGSNAALPTPFWVIPPV